MQISFTNYTDEDKAEVLEMMVSFNKMEGYAFDPIIREKNLLEFTSDESLGRLYVIKLQQQTIGYLVLAFGFSFEYKGRDAFIDEFYIKPDYRNKGIGKTTLDFVASESKKLDVKALHLEVEPHNIYANKLYLSKGYSSNDRKLMTKKI
ncbi:GNAT family N-acetyltransferase [Aquimarina litoralis]|uniref:GNAT family N-acetyltransferase n=1 Tax=Aquimarina litoralis TaxID=584605 RepID=UPI001C59F91E|nr:GNAT family N-acetyltransferase [Aquimarina litoralis]MBW1294971.1 GNAT family N-acetyltransferase [Aquimarina litoralis]